VRNREAKKPFWRPKDVGKRPGYFVAKDLKMIGISGALALLHQAVCLHTISII